MSKKIAAALLASVSFAAYAQGIVFGAAPEGDPKTVAARVIRANFDEPDCPRITTARRLGDKSIRATCSNGEEYRIATVFDPDRGRVIEFALRCSAARKMGVPGC